jgi:hypothetical protein
VLDHLRPALADYLDPVTDVGPAARPAGLIIVSALGFYPVMPRSPDLMFSSLGSPSPLDGRYRVYRNRMRGVTTDVWTKPYNNTGAASGFQYPTSRATMPVPTGQTGDYHRRVYLRFGT